jgi:hypothetical protein
MPAPPFLLQKPLAAPVTGILGDTYTVAIRPKITAAGASAPSELSATLTM